MRLVLVAAANRQPSWVDEGFAEYARRFRGAYALELKEIPLAPRGRNAPAAAAVEREGERMLAAVPAGARVVALDERGPVLSTSDLAARLVDWQRLGAPVHFLVGGPDGLSPGCLARAEERWSLSRLTLPHGLVRIIVAEALYRAWTVLEHHPYHRAKKWGQTPFFPSASDATFSPGAGKIGSDPIFFAAAAKNGV
ncbi:MAG TPA: 23S rRNA (pseudouridine(1915)-N(3))-methyltransferase RlmH [Gammaproteobacteria bacterium]|nr:23S rRNA (pseudouridine(1915)-N(3))-methyltransferase RlmH [Gammaproteobacteria bacterium]